MLGVQTDWKVSTTVSVAGSITVTVLALTLGTYTRGSVLPRAGLSRPAVSP